MNKNFKKMKEIKKILKERTGGLFLLSLAVIIVVGLSLSSKHAESKNGGNLTNENQNSDEAQVLDSKQTSGDVANIQQGAASVSSESNLLSSPSSQEEAVTTQKETLDNSQANVCVDLKPLLKKSCGKDFSVKKCREYLIKAKKYSKDDVLCKSLYKKYHYEKKDTKKDTTNTSNPDTTNTLNETLVITSGGDSKSYDISAPSGINVLDLMKLANVSYDTSSGGLVDNVDKMGANSGDMSWMLYACKNDTCKLSNVGASDFKIDGFSKIEWKYVDWNKIENWDAWN